MLYDRGQFSAYDANTGAPIYEKQELPKGAGYTASPWASNGHIYCLNEDGITHVLRAGDTFEVVASNALTDNAMGMATPALTPERLLLRTATRLYAIGAK